MKRNLVVFSAVLLVVLFAAGVNTQDAQAIGLLGTPEEICLDAINNNPDYKFHSGSGWYPEEGKCILGWTYIPDGWKNICYPHLDTWEFVEYSGNIYADADVVYSGYIPIFVGCSGDGSFVKDPNSGEAKMGDGITFEYEAQTCTNGCDVTKFGITGAAKNALGSLKGKVIGKSYVQIRDHNGDLVAGDFKLCYQAKGAKNPYFFRFGGGNGWSPVGGYWNGTKFCMNGTTSGNYVLVDMP